MSDRFGRKNSLIVGLVTGPTQLIVARAGMAGAAVLMPHGLAVLFLGPCVASHFRCAFARDSGETRVDGRY